MRALSITQVKSLPLSAANTEITKIIAVKIDLLPFSIWLITDAAAGKYARSALKFHLCIGRVRMRILRRPEKLYII